MRHTTFAGITYGGVPVYTAVLNRSGSGSLTFSNVGIAISVSIRLGSRGKLSFPGNSLEVDQVPVQVMAIVSTITAASQRFALQAELQPAGSDFARSGLLVGGSGHADLVKVTAMEAKVTPFQAFVSGADTTQPGYIVTNDEDTVITFDAGSGTNPRIDLVVVRVRDDPYDGSGAQDGAVEIIQGTPSASPTAPDVPATSVPLWQVLIPAATTAAVGVDFDSARTDRRPWTTGIGGVIPVGSVTERNSIASPYAGMKVWRSDLNWREVYDGTAWRVPGPLAVPSFAALTSWVTDPYDGQTAVISGDNDLLQWDGALSTWVSFVKAALPFGQATWPPYTPTLTQSNSVSKTVTSATYTQTGRIVTANVRLDVTSNGTPNAVVKFGLPVTAALSSGAIGRGYIYDSSANVYQVGTVVLDSTSVAKIAASGSTDYLGAPGSLFTAALSLNDVVSFAVRYEAA